jgi:hypothetical protein
MTDKSRITQDPKAWREGYNAGRRRLGIRANPYPRDSAESFAWISGLIEGKAIEGKARPLRSIPARPSIKGH